METLGHISFKQIFYCHVRTDKNWFEKLPADHWFAFTIADIDDEAMIPDVAVKCMDKNVSCVCCAGQLASHTSDHFNIEAVEWEIKKAEANEADGENARAPLITAHKNFSEGFWFATSIASDTIEDKYLDVDKVICIDMTKNAVRKYLRNLVGEFNSGGLPSDSEFEEPEYDDGQSGIGNRQSAIGNWQSGIGNRE